MRAGEAHVEPWLLLVGRRGVQQSRRHTRLTLRYGRTGTSNLARALCSLPMGAMFAFAFVKGVLSRFWGIQWAVSDCGGLANRLAARSLRKI